MDLIDLADPIRLLILLLPERYRGPAAALITALVAAQGIAASIVSRLPLAAAQHPRWGRVVRALHWYSLLRFRDEKGTTKAIGADLAPRVTVAPTIALPAEKQGALDASETRPPGVAHPAQLFAPSFDPGQRQTIAPEVVAAARDATRDGQRGSTSLSAALAAVALIGIVGAVGLMVMGCPRMPPVSGCQPEAQTCIADAPHVCSASQRWHRAGDLSCAAVSGQCMVMGGRAFCAPVADAAVGGDL